ncbi:M12 family metallo-peptidase [Lysobacter arvi]|uniref:Zinc-dependent metalloprotease family protein n=1 Tax=Lysobacter arvi TaxID=3038776 RepID=A0ABU1C939_9GAMM|nr:zinc-dependent metalloprotease family protein [Lysobacter arvi]MDR0181694.1 zinc-dependent metalloprotease family protein [Lysobacter arvi]
MRQHVVRGSTPAHRRESLSPLTGLPMKNALTAVLALMCAVAFSAHAQDASLTPNQIGGGALPNGYDRIAFTLYDGNYAPTVFLPSNPRDRSVVVLRTQASYGVDLDASRTDLAVGKLALARNVSYTLQFSASTGRWTMSGDGVSHFTPLGQGAAIPDNPRRIAYYSMADGNWVPTVTLPGAADDGTVLVVRSTATYGAQIAPTHQLFANTTAIRTGDSYTFVYRQAQSAWALASAPVRRLIDKQIVSGVPSPTTPRTLIEFWDGNWTDTIRLPALAGDRDRITVRSQATWPSRIDNANVNFPGTMRLSRGDEYQFTYLASIGRWEMTAHPSSTYRAGELTASNGVLPAITHPRTTVDFSDGNYVATLTLPSAHRPGDRVVVRTSATYGFAVVADGLTVPVTTGEIVSFAADADNRWQKETRTIDLLMLYSDKASAKLGDNAMRARLIEGLGLTNDALENSRANFRFRSVGLRQVPARSTWTDLGHPLSELRADPTVQGWRNQSHADGLYYEGTENGCGLAWLSADAYSMIASGAIGCGTTVMRHELGHNMGLDHSAGHVYPGTIMAGNQMPFFAAPYLLAEDGLPLTPSGGWNEVATMNARSAAVAAFR